LDEVLVLRTVHGGTGHCKDFLNRCIIYIFAYRVPMDVTRASRSFTSAFRSFSKQARHFAVGELGLEDKAISLMLKVRIEEEKRAFQEVLLHSKLEVIMVEDGRAGHQLREAAFFRSLR
jgi:hypothetical protein